VGALKDTRPDVRQFFLGMKHPNPDVPAMQVAWQARGLADELGLTDRNVFFGDWLEYDQRVGVLLDADLAISTHHDHVETRYSFRTRLLDALWAGLPVVTTAGDALADTLTAAGAGVAVPPGDATALATVVEALLADDGARADAGAAARRQADGAQGEGSGPCEDGVAPGQVDHEGIAGARRRLPVHAPWFCAVVVHRCLLGRFAR
jgi:glycosyltransferase involved in cell wall biosynthesis